ncbi:MAG: sunset domain-containing protein, partial [Acidimicrobiales bacterium]
MRRLLRWVLTAAMVAGAGWVLRLALLERAARRRPDAQGAPWPDPPTIDAPPASRPPVPPTPAAAPGPAEKAVPPAPAAPHHPAPPHPAAGSSSAEPAPWVTPLDGGACPVSHPIKAKLRSKVFHLPGMVAYDRTGADRCYVAAEAAETDG